MLQFMQGLLRSLFLNRTIDAGYLAMAADKMREAEAMEWVKALRGDGNDRFDHTPRLYEKK